MPTVTYEGPKDKRGQSGGFVVETPEGRVKLVKGEPQEVSADQADAVVAAAQALNHVVSVKGRKRKAKGESGGDNGEDAS